MRIGPQQGGSTTCDALPLRRRGPLQRHAAHPISGPACVLHSHPATPSGPFPSQPFLAPPDSPDTVARLCRITPTFSSSARARPMKASRDIAGGSPSGPAGEVVWRQARQQMRLTKPSQEQHARLWLCGTCVQHASAPQAGAPSRQAGSPGRQGWGSAAGGRCPPMTAWYTSRSARWPQEESKLKAASEGPARRSPCRQRGTVGGAQVRRATGRAAAGACALSQGPWPVVAGAVHCNLQPRPSAVLLAHPSNTHLGERPERLQPACHRRSKAALAAQRGEHQAILRAVRLVGAVRAPELLRGAGWGGAGQVGVRMALRGALSSVEVRCCASLQHTAQQSAALALQGAALTWMARSADQGSSSVRCRRRLWLAQRRSACSEMPAEAASEMMATSFWPAGGRQSEQATQWDWLQQHAAGRCVRHNPCLHS